MWLTKGQGASVVPSLSALRPRSGSLQTEDHLRLTESSSNVAGSALSKALTSSSVYSSIVYFDLNVIYKHRIKRIPKELTISLSILRVCRRSLLSCLLAAISYANCSCLASISTSLIRSRSLGPPFLNLCDSLENWLYFDDKRLCSFHTDSVPL